MSYEEEDTCMSYEEPASTPLLIFLLSVVALYLISIYRHVAILAYF